MKKLIAAALLGVASSSWAGYSSPSTTIEFEGTAQHPAPTQSVYREDGYTFFTDFGNESGYPPWYFDNGAAKFNETGSPHERILSLTKDDGGLFNVSSLDVLERTYDACSYPAGPLITSGVTVLGLLGGTQAFSWTTQSTCNFDANGRLAVNNLNPFMSFAIDQIVFVGGDFRGAAIDNVILAAIPEPSTYAMMFAGLAAVGLIAKRRRATTRHKAN